jgi:FKBP-type peptidyl-prolyl cis-trans isomerase FklB
MLTFVQNLSNTMNDKEKLSYSLGMNIAGSLKNQGFEDLDAHHLAQGINDLLNGASLQMTEAEGNAFINTYFAKLQEKKYEANIKAGKDFLEANGKKDGVITLASGLQYEVINEGNGAKPGLTSTVTTHYHGTLIDGTVFDSSVQRGTPASFPVNGVIAGWTEALQLMPLGSKWRLFVPSNLAYGAQGAGQQIGPHTTLIFEVELLDIK